MNTSTVAPRPDRDSQAWWNGLGARKLYVQACGQCRRRRWPLREICAYCGSVISDLVESRGTGRVATWTTVRRSPDPRLTVPYVVVLIRLDDDADILVPGWYDGPQDGSDLVIGMPVTVDFVAVETDLEAEPQTLLRWRAAQ